MFMSLGQREIQTDKQVGEQAEGCLPVLLSLFFTAQPNGLQNH
jgi:hypothetical protein